MQAYSDPSRESSPHTLPDVEVFHSGDYHGPDNPQIKPGWYWWPCSPGCLPDGDPVGPFATEAAALADAQDRVGPDEGPGFAPYL